jgi:hypothetical protein
MQGLRVHRYCVQRFRAPSIGWRGCYAGVRAYAAYGEAPLTRYASEFHERDAGCIRRARLGFGLICGSRVLQLRPEAAGFTNR